MKGAAAQLANKGSCCLLLVACLIFGPEGQAHKGFGGSYPLSERPRKVSPCEARTYPAVIIEPWFGTRAG